MSVRVCGFVGRVKPNMEHRLTPRRWRGQRISNEQTQKKNHSSVSLDRLQLLSWVVQQGLHTHTHMHTHAHTP